MKRWTWAAYRILWVLPLLLAVLVVVFVSTEHLPGNRLLLEAGKGISRAELARLQRLEGDRDESAPARFLRFCGRVLRLDFGTLPNGRKVTEEYLSRLPATALLAVSAFALALIWGVGSGVICASTAGGALDRILGAAAVAGQSAPVFWCALLLLYLFSLRWNLLPPSGDDTWLHLVLPTVTLGTRPAAMLQRIARISMLEVLEADYIRTARSKGVPEWRVLLGHALPNAAPPIAAAAALDLASLLSGAIITEAIFRWKGIGSLMMYGIENRHMGIITAGVLLTTLIYVCVNTAVDLLVWWMDPSSDSGVRR